MASKYARDLQAGDRVVLVSGRAVTLDGVKTLGGPDYRVELAYRGPNNGPSEWHEGVAWDTRWTVI